MWACVCVWLGQTFALFTTNIPVCNKNEIYGLRILDLQFRILQIWVIKR